MAAAIHGALAGLRVLVFDNAGIDFDKPCGEGLMPLALKRLGMLGVIIPESYPLTGIHYLLPGKGEMKRIEATFVEGHCGIGVRRKVLRRAMWERALALGVEIQEETVRSVMNLNHGIRVNERTSDYLVVAEGLHSQTTRKLNLLRPRSKKNRFGVRQHFQVRPWSNFVEVWWGDFFEIYVTPVAPEVINIALLSERPISLKQALDAFPILKEKLATVSTLDKIAGAGPLLHRTSKKRQGRILLAGDAAGFIDAMTGEGNTLALGSGMAASQAILDKRLWMYNLRWWHIVWRYWVLTRVAAGIAVRPWLRLRSLSMLERAPVLLKWGLRFLAAH